ncbi:ATPase V1 complex subunit C [Coniophora puteana RWD-64-598 SS2]|uniref:V-type proton ATPase subunit C n=1 Tax=Coniophora puteana (strain RWD-64-598) TaxID=741705 RepID=A0A5M3N5D2_CONPW|nr:ATPase V1 complex subunit C [Coniophora puteana RWD-64-598 SS2]EIW86516.1 ATPase V1 complex subunit C [Coniophora puteana RWD-64-598 SS2]
MPSDQSTWLIAVPQDGDAEGLLPEITTKLSQQSKAYSRDTIAELGIPSFKTGTLDSLIALSEELPKQDTFFTSVVAKTVDTLRNLLNNDPSKLSQHILVNERAVDDYLFKGWKWNEGRYGVQRSLREIVDLLNKEVASIDNVMKAKLNNYNLVKGSLVQMQRKKTGNLSVRSLVDIVSKEHIINESEYLDTMIVAVPNNLNKEWNSKYERLTSMVVPRSSISITSDSEYTLYSVVVFKRVRDEFTQKCRENKFIVRDFVFSEDEIVKQKEELAMADTTEKELWTELLRLSRTNFSESFQLLVHLKVVRLFVESVLRYGLPSNYVGLAIKPEPKTTKKALALLTDHFGYLSPRSGRPKKVAGGNEDFAGEYQTLMEQEYYDFVLFEVPWIVN